MNPSGNQSISRNFHPRQHGTRLYVWIVTGSTLLLLVMLLWPMSVKRFQSTVTFQLRFDPATHLAKRDINRLFIEEIREQTKPARVSTIFSALTSEPTSPLLVSADTEKIRDAIRIQNRPGAAPNTLWYRVSLLGQGSTDEVEFVNALVSRVTANIGTSVLKRDANLAVDRLTKDVSTHQHELSEQYSRQLAVAMNSLTAAGNELQIVIDQINALHGSGTTDDPLQKQLEQLEAQKKQWLSQPNANPYHPAFTQLQLQIESLKSQIDLGPISISQTAQPSTGNVQRVTNQFISNRKEMSINPALFDSTIKELVAEMQMIDVSSPYSKLNLLQESIEQQNFDSQLLIQRMNQRAKDKLSTANPLSFDGIQLARRSRPIGGVPTLGRFLMLGMTAGLIATAIAWKFDPATRRRRFLSIEQIQTKLEIPVVGTLKARPLTTPTVSIGSKISALILIVCEWTLLLMLLALIVAALMNSEVIAALLENPFEAASKTFWLIAPHK